MSFFKFMFVMVLTWPAQAGWTTCITPETHMAAFTIMYPAATKEVHLEGAAAEGFMTWVNENRPIYRVGNIDELIVHSKPDSDEVSVAVFVEGCVVTFIYIPTKAFPQKYPGT